MKRILAVALGITALSVSAVAQAGVKVDIVFKNPGYTYTGSSTTTCADGLPSKVPSGADPTTDLTSCVNLDNVRIYLVSTNQSCWMTNGNRACKFDDVQTSDNSPKLFRFEWRADIGRPAQVVDAWIDVPSTNTWNQTWVYDVPSHNVVFTSDVGNRDIGMISQGIVGDRRGLSIINKKTDAVIPLKGNLPGGGWFTNVAMLDGCYAVYYYADNTCPGDSCSRNYLDYPLCVGGGPGAYTEVDLATDDVPVLYPSP